VTDEVGLHCVGHGQGVAIGDIDNDGFPDVFVTGYGRNWLFHNEGGKRFTDITTQSGTNDSRWSTSASFCDYNKSGRLSLFVLAYATWTVENNRTCFGPAGRRDYCGPEVFKPLPARLLRNDGNGRFTDVSQAAGVRAAFGPGLGIVCADFNGDGWPDFYVANDGMANQLWINRGNGTFQDQAVLAGAALDPQGKPEHGMGVDAEDFRGTGHPDVIVTNLLGEGTAVYLNDGTGNFREGRDQVGLGGPTRGYTQWATRWFDYDNSGNLSVFIVNGAVKMEASQVERSKFPYEQVNFKLYRNAGNGRYEDASASAGPAFQLMGVGRGAAFGSLRNDGAIDIVVTNNNGPVRVLLNEAAKRNHWLMVKLDGTKSNRDGAGAQVAILRPGKPPTWRRAHSDGSYFSASDIRVHFGLGQDTGLEGVAVVWPSGRREVWREIKADSIVKLREGTGAPWQNEQAWGGASGRVAHGGLFSAGVFSVCGTSSSWWRAAPDPTRAGCPPWTLRQSPPTTEASGSWAGSTTRPPVGSSRS
jgi:enediyne biosynthesis protein E4